MKIISNQLNIKLRQFTQEELDSVLRKIKNRKVVGLDEIPPEAWKTREFDDILLQHCNAVYNQSTIDKWTKGCIFPFSKKGDFGIAKNYRGITLTPIAAKIYNALQHCNAVYNQNTIDKWTKGCIFPFPKKGNFGIAKNYRGITLTPIAAKIYNAQQRNHIEPKIEKILM